MTDEVAGDSPVSGEVRWAAGGVGGGVGGGGQ